MQKINDFIKLYSWIKLLPLVLILALAGGMYLHNLGTDYITLWDEAVHVNVVKNLVQDPWPPKLHLTDIGIDFQDWTNNYIWVHKPLAPLYLQSVFYKVSPSLFMFRLPGAIFALLSACALYFVAKKYFGYWPALIATCLFAFNSYIFELVKGRQFSGLHDLIFVFWAILALGTIFKILEKPTRKAYLWFGIFTALAYLSKGGLALFFFPSLFAATLCAKNKKEAFLNFCYAGLLALVLVLPEKLMLTLKFPAEYVFEQSAQILHLFKDLEYWGRPWDYYLTMYLRDMLLPYLYLPVLVGVAYSFTKLKINRNILVLTIWVLSYLLPLSFGVTKISNFIFAALPAMLILFALMVKDFWENRQYAILFALSFTAWVSYIVVRLDLWRVKFELFQDQIAFQRFAILIYECLVFFALWVIYLLLEKYLRKISVFVKPLAVLTLFLILGTYARASQLADLTKNRDLQYQERVKQAGLSVQKTVPVDSIFLLNFSNLPKAHLYFQYWSGLDAMEIYDRQPIFVLEKIMPVNRSLFMLSDGQFKRSGWILIEKSDFGFLYRYSN